MRLQYWRGHPLARTLEDVAFRIFLRNDDLQGGGGFKIDIDPVVEALDRASDRLLVTREPVDSSGFADVSSFAFIGAC